MALYKRAVFFLPHITRQWWVEDGWVLWSVLSSVGPGTSQLVLSIHLEDWDRELWVIPEDWLGVRWPSGASYSTLYSPGRDLTLRLGLSVKKCSCVYGREWEMGNWWINKLFLSQILFFNVSKVHYLKMTLFNPNLGETVGHGNYIWLCKALSNATHFLNKVHKASCYISTILRTFEYMALIF